MGESGVTGVQEAGVQEFRSSGVQEFRSQESGVRSQESGVRSHVHRVRMALNLDKGKIAAAYKSKVCSFHSELLTPELLLPEIASFWIESPKLGITLGVEMAQSRKHNAWNEVMGLVLLGAGTVLFLALISYTPKDVP